MTADDPAREAASLELNVEPRAAPSVGAREGPNVQPNVEPKVQPNVEPKRRVNEVPATLASSTRNEAASELSEWIRQRTPARILVGRAGPAYRTATQLELRRDHAAAVDAVWAELDLERDLGRPFLDTWRLFEVGSCAATKEEFLRRPDLGRRLADAACRAIAENCPADIDLQIVLSDGLSATAIAAQAPALLPLLVAEAKDAGWKVGRPFFVRRGRVGLLNDIGRILRPQVAVLLIGERPGLATAESLSAYMAYQPRPGDTDARRNLVSNIHRRGVSADAAAQRIIALANKMRLKQTSGVDVKED